MKFRENLELAIAAFDAEDIDSLLSYLDDAMRQLTVAVNEETLPD